jgi:hypothetical protein
VVCLRQCDSLPFTQTILGTGDTIDEERLVEFRLLYSGRLLGASRSDTRSSHKHAIRREFHPQLRHLWTTNINLRRTAATYGIAKVHNQQIQNFNQEGIFGPCCEPKMDHGPYLELGFKSIGENWNRQGYNFIPLVTESMCLKCSIEILFLRPEEPGRVIQSGDIDNRIKTLFDALRIPQRAECVNGERAQEGEDPFFCLLEDDSLITEVKITTDKLLLLPGSRELNDNDVFLALTVRLNPTIPGVGQWVFN